jgi:hypothetical protein
MVLQVVTYYGKRLGRRREVAETNCEVLQAYQSHPLRNFSIIAHLPRLLAEAVGELVQHLAKVLGLFVGFRLCFVSSSTVHHSYS